MHIAHILRKYDPAQWGGTETAVHRLLKGLRLLGTEGTVHFPQASRMAQNDPLRQTAHAMRPYRPVLPVSGISAHQRNRLYSWGGNLFSFDLFWHLLFDPSIQVIHSHALNRLAGIGMLAARLRRVPFVVTLHGGALDLPASAHEQLIAPLKGGFEWGKALGWLVQSRRVLEKADAVITCNPREADLLRQRHPAQNILVEPHSVPAASYQRDHRAAALRAFPQLAGRRVLVKLARIDPVKNHAWLVAQLPEMVRRHPDVLLVFAGSISCEATGRQLRSTIARLGLEDHVLFTGPLEPGSGELIGLLQCAAALVHSSIVETFGIIVLEAWAAGTPVIVSRSSGTESLVRHGINGFLYDLDAPQAFHAALQTAVTQRETIAATALDEVQSRYSTEAAAQRMSALYQRLIHAKQTRP